MSDIFQLFKILRKRKSENTDSKKSKPSMKDIVAEVIEAIKLGLRTNLH